MFFDIFVIYKFEICANLREFKSMLEKSEKERNKSKRERKRIKRNRKESERSTFRF